MTFVRRRTDTRDGSRRTERRTAAKVLKSGEDAKRRLLQGDRESAQGQRFECRSTWGTW